MFDSPDDPEETVDMVRPFTIAWWVCYCNQKEDEPGLESDECQEVGNLKSHMWTHLQFTCETHTIHMRNTYNSHAKTYNSHVRHMQVTCDTHLVHMRNTCETHVIHMWNTCEPCHVWQLLKYLQLNTSNLVAGWRARLYFYSSGTLFKQIQGPLLEWLAVDQKHRVTCLRRLTDDDPDSELFQIVGDIIFRFIQHKKAPFPSAVLSQEDYLNVPVFKHALIFSFLYRIACDEHMSQKYTDWTAEEYNLTQELFHRFACELHVIHMCITCTSHVIPQIQEEGHEDLEGQFTPEVTSGKVFRYHEKTSSQRFFFLRTGLSAGTEK